MNYSKKSFSLLGVLISLQILVVAIVAIIGLISSTIISSKTAGNRIIAQGLAQEGIEIVRNIRDKNWLAGLAWRSGLSDESYQAEYNSASLLPLNAENKKMIYNSNSWYVPAETGVSGTDTIFERIISLSTSTGDEGEMIVECEIAWSERGRNYSVKLEDWLYDWR